MTSDEKFYSHCDVVYSRYFVNPLMLSDVWHGRRAEISTHGRRMRNV